MQHFTSTGESLSRPAIDPIAQHRFGSSISSAPDVYLKKRGSLVRPPKFPSQDESREGSCTDFAKSWPLSPNKGMATKLPKISTNKTNNVSTEEGDFRSNIAKFNQSRRFRMKNLDPLEEKPKDVSAYCFALNDIKVRFGNLRNFVSLLNRKRCH